MFAVAKANSLSWKSVMVWHTPSDYQHANPIASAQGPLNNLFRQALAACMGLSFHLPFDLHSFVTCLDERSVPWESSGFSRLRGVAAVPQLAPNGGDHLKAGHYLPGGHILIEGLHLRNHEAPHAFLSTQIRHRAVLLLVGGPVLLNDVP